MLEIAVDGLVSATNAVNGGAKELVLCSCLSDGGLTPSFGLVCAVQSLVSTLSPDTRPKVHVVIRCRVGEYLYSEPEMATMLRDVQLFREINVDGFVFGALTPRRDVDDHNCIKVLAAARPGHVTFSQAFDHVRDAAQAADVLVSLGFRRVHTAGDQANISFLCSRYRDSELRVVPCGGVAAGTVGCFVAMGCGVLHATCRAPKPGPRVLRRFSLCEDASALYVTDQALVRELVDTIDRAVDERNNEDADKH